MTTTGVILAYHKNRPPKDFVVLKRVTGTEYPTVNISREILEHEKTGGYLHVWFQEFALPKIPQ